jgi:hypothetical protein
MVSTSVIVLACMEHSTDKGQDLQTGVYEHNWWLTVLRPDGSISARQWDRMPWPDVKGKRCLDVWTFDESLRFEMAGYRVTNLAGDPGYRGASKGAGLALRDSVVHPTSAFASRHRQPGSADTFGSAVVTEDDVRRYSLMQGYEYIARPPLLCRVQHEC